MKPAVEHICIFFTALITHWKWIHGGHGPVVGEVPDNGKAGTAIGAIDKRVIDPVLLILHVKQAGIAYGDIRAHIGDLIRCVFTLFNEKRMKFSPAVLMMSILVMLEAAGASPSMAARNDFI